MNGTVLSVVICTRNRVAKLERTLAALRVALGDRADCEVLVSDNGSTDGTVELVRVLASCDRRFRLVVQPTPGVSRAFNAAIVETRGEIIGCIDDDCYVTATYVDDLLRVFEAQPDLAFCGGRILQFNPQHARLTIQESTERVEFPPQTILPPGAIQGANMAFRRTVVEQVGGYCEQFGPGAPFSGNDIEFLVRASMSGLRGSYEPSITVHHDHGRDAEAARRRRGEYARGSGAYYMRALIDDGGLVVLAKRFYWSLLVAFSPSSLRKFSQMGVGAAAYLWMRITRPRAFSVPRVGRPAPAPRDGDASRPLAHASPMRAR